MCVFWTSCLYDPSPIGPRALVSLGLQCRQSASRITTGEETLRVLVLVTRLTRYKVDTLQGGTRLVIRGELISACRRYRFKNRELKYVRPTFGRGGWIRKIVNGLYTMSTIAIELLRQLTFIDTTSAIATRSTRANGTEPEVGAPRAGTRSLLWRAHSLSI